MKTAKRIMMNKKILQIIRTKNLLKFKIKIQTVNKLLNKQMVRLMLNLKNHHRRRQFQKTMQIKVIKMIKNMMKLTKRQMTLSNLLKICLLSSNMIWRKSTNNKMKLMKLKNKRKKRKRKIKMKRKNNKIKRITKLSKKLSKIFLRNKHNLKIRSNKSNNKISPNH